MQNLNARAAAAGTTVLGLFSSAHAALPPEAAAAFTSLSGNVTDINSAVWPILATVTGAFALMKLFKRGTNRAI